MTEESATPAATPTKSPAHGAPRVVGIGCAAVIAVPLLVILGYAITYSVQRSTPEDYPRMAPEEMGRRVAGNSQEAYTALGFNRVVPQTGEDSENYTASSYCYPGGLESIADQSVDGAYRLYHRWALDNVPKNEALPALRRLREHLKDSGWRITDYGQSKDANEWNLQAQRGGHSEDGGDYEVSFSWNANRQSFTGGSGAPCAYDPQWKKSDPLPGTELEPPGLTPR
ncbi:hypothetical protein J7E91_15845 [Streptomyces sp. ISL-99]|uniref:hypothetical protein n=1 Tax=Streptomyces sp. ISL-99 TaxID=2819193 RepID=UPI001BE59A3A|nr:hypothetical protein [Streptomyces sp. ISL-99]MBT2526858.1 hypothetical protein [Streptomyces sp. ISL-99]